MAWPRPPPGPRMPKAGRRLPAAAQRAGLPSPLQALAEASTKNHPSSVARVCVCVCRTSTDLLYFPSHQVLRFFMQVATDRVSLTALGVVPITRPLMLAVSRTRVLCPQNTAQPGRAVKITSYNCSYWAPYCLMRSSLCSSTTITAKLE